MVTDAVLDRPRPRSFGSPPAALTPILQAADDSALRGRIQIP